MTFAPLRHAYGQAKYAQILNQSATPPLAFSGVGLGYGAKHKARVAESAIRALRWFETT
jgi:hypothetical protein